MIEEQKLNEFLLSDSLQNGLFEEVMDVVSSVEMDEIRKIIDGILVGQVVFFSDVLSKVKLFFVGQNLLCFIMELEFESIVCGVYDGFVESLEMNIYQLWFYIQDCYFFVYYMDIGKWVKLKVVVIFVENIVNLEIVEEVKWCFLYLCIDSVFVFGIIEELIEDNLFFIFLQIVYMEWLDKVKVSVMEGCVFIMMDGSLLVLIVLIMFFLFF